MAQSTSQKRARLKRLSAQTKHNIYDMLRLADEILSDHEYVDEFGGESHLIDQMEQDEFAHFGRKPTLGAMLLAYRENPDKGLWEDNNYNIQVMIDLTTRSTSKASTPRTNWKARAIELALNVDVDILRSFDWYEDLIVASPELRARVKEDRRRAVA